MVAAQAAAAAHVAAAMKAAARQTASSSRCVPRRVSAAQPSGRQQRGSGTQRLQRRRQTSAQQPHPAVAAAASPFDLTPADSEGSGSSSSEQPAIDTTYERLDQVGQPDASMDPAVAEALKKVQQALSNAEQSMQTLHTLPSARLPTLWDRLLSALRPLSQFAALAAVCAAVHSFGLLGRVLGGLAVALVTGWYGWHRTSLSASGALAAVLVGWGTLGSSFRSGLLLLTFFFASSKLTQFGEELKDVDEDHKKGGQRDWKQVFCNALVPTGLALAAAYYSGGADLALGASASAGTTAAVGQLGRLLTALHGAFLGYYACCCGDTWASELGQLSPEEPRLITTLRPVRKGTNGGVTLLGLAASLAGGLFMGATFYLSTLISPTGPGLAAAAAATRQWRLVELGVGAGLVGSLIDSLLGATIQFTGYNRVTGKITGRPGPDVSPISGFPVLDNNMVNAVSASATAALAGLASLVLF